MSFLATRAFLRPARRLTSSPLPPLTHGPAQRRTLITLKENLVRSPSSPERPINKPTYHVSFIIHPLQNPVQGDRHVHWWTRWHNILYAHGR